MIMRVTKVAPMALQHTFFFFFPRIVARFGAAGVVVYAPPTQTEAPVLYLCVYTCGDSGSAQLDGGGGVWRTS